LFDPRREHSSAPTAYFHRRRAQRRSRTALLQRRRRLVLDRREHGGRLPATGGWPREDPRGACHWPRSIANHACIRLNPMGSWPWSSHTLLRARLRGGGSILSAALQP